MDELVRSTAPLFRAIIHFIGVVGPLYAQVAILLYNVGRLLPWNLLQAVLGFGICFFGGGYCASIAAVEAFTLTGWVTTRAALMDVYEEVQAARNSTRGRECARYGRSRMRQSGKMWGLKPSGALNTSSAI